MTICLGVVGAKRSGANRKDGRGNEDCEEYVGKEHVGNVLLSAKRSFGL